MLGEFTRMGREGTVVCYRLEGTMELLWKAPTLSVPRVNEEVGLLENSEVTTWYKVEKIRRELQYPTGIAGGGEVPEEPYTADYAQEAIIVIVSEVI